MSGASPSMRPGWPYPPPPRTVTQERIEALKAALRGPCRDEVFTSLKTRDQLREAGWVDKAYGYTILTVKGLEVAHYLGLTEAR